MADKIIDGSLKVTGGLVDSNNNSISVDNLATLDTAQTFSSTKTFSGDTTSFSGRKISITAKVDSSLIPLYNNDRDLGLANYKWRDLYLEGIINGSSSTGLKFGFDGASSYTLTNSSFRRNTDNTADLGTSSLRWKNIYSSGTVYTNGISSSVATLQITSGAYDTNFDGVSFRPVTDNGKDLGSSGLRWRDLHLSRNLTDGTNSISVANIQPKLTAGTGIAINNNVISSTLDGVDYEVVSELPLTGKKGTIYLVPNGESGTQNIYDEYIFIPAQESGEEDKFEFIGTTETDLTNYPQKNANETITGAWTFNTPINITTTSSNPNNIKWNIRNSGEGDIDFYRGTSRYIRISATNFRPTVSIDLGSSANNWKDLYLSGNLTDGTNSVSVQQLVNKADKVIAQESGEIIEGRLAGLDATGNLTNSNIAIDNVALLDANNTFSGSNKFTKDVVIDANHKLAIEGSNAYSIGKSGNNMALTAWNDFEFGSYNGNTTNLIPQNNKVGNLGTSNKKWSKAYVSEYYVGTYLEPITDSSTRLGHATRRFNYVYTKKLGNENQTYGLTLPDTTNFTADKTIATTDEIPQVKRYI